ncbi:MAG: hypothetical protein M1561_08120 [Gammaproteobacteria bacterium]|nr:hypothetical protein [Gammaproteobacteria bacterium]
MADEKNAPKPRSSFSLEIADFIRVQVQNYINSRRKDNANYGLNSDLFAQVLAKYIGNKELISKITGKSSPLDEKDQDFVTKLAEKAAEEQDSRDQLGTKI